MAERHDSGREKIKWQPVDVMEKGLPDNPDIERVVLGLVLLNDTVEIPGKRRR